MNPTLNSPTESTKRQALDSQGKSFTSQKDWFTMVSRCTFSLMLVNLLKCVYFLLLFQKQQQADAFLGKTPRQGFLQNSRSHMPPSSRMPKSFIPGGGNGGSQGGSPFDKPKSQNGDDERPPEKKDQGVPVRSEKPKRSPDFHDMLTEFLKFGLFLNIYCYTLLLAIRIGPFVTRKFEQLQVTINSKVIYVKRLGKET